MLIIVPPLGDQRNFKTPGFLVENSGLTPNHVSDNPFYPGFKAYLVMLEKQSDVVKGFEDAKPEIAVAHLSYCM